jgi:hypothetical protein
MIRIQILDCTLNANTLTALVDTFHALDAGGI